MSSTITALTSGGGIALAGDTSGQLELKTNNGTTAVTIDTSQRAAFVAGTAALPAITTTGDTNTGIYFPTADTIAFTEGGTESMRIDSSGNVGIGTSSPGSYANQTTLAVNGTNYGRLDLMAGGTVYGYLYGGSAGITLETGGALPVAFATAATERMRITSAGNALFNKTSTGANFVGFEMENGGAFLAVRNDGPAVIVNRLTATGSLVLFRYNSSGVGDISTNGTTTSYNVTSDRRLKENIIPFTTGLSTVLQLKPSEYNYIKDPSTQMQGFIADELQAVVPNAVTGEINAVDEEGKPVYQGVDVSFLIPHLVSAIQELNAKVDAQALEIQALKGVA